VYRTILVGTDGSTTANKAVDRAVDVARATGATVTILSVGPPDRAARTVAAEVERVGASASGVEVRTKVESGDPSHVLLDEAERGGYDLLVVGNKGMTGASRFFLGSVPNKVSHHAPCALLIVRTT
jgi:nucleotide-binding universal stress UspA family protein